jgi:hypothetical protein
MDRTKPVQEGVRVKLPAGLILNLKTAKALGLEVPAQTSASFEVMRKLIDHCRQLDPM